MTRSKMAIWKTEQLMKEGVRATLLTKLIEISSEPHCQILSAKEVTGLGKQLTEGKENLILNHWGVNLCQTRNIRSH